MKMNNKQLFEQMALMIKRDGVGNLLKWLETTDFYEAPASTKFHDSHKGGLVEHSLNVYHELLQLVNYFAHGVYSIETILIVSLFHDVCKANYYKETTRNVKNETTGQWEKQPYYTVEEKEPFGGHGSKSVYWVSKFIQLEPYEASAINCHMGAWDTSTYNNPSAVFQVNQLAWLLHVADEKATYYPTERNNKNDNL